MVVEIRTWSIRTSTPRLQQARWTRSARSSTRSGARERKGRAARLGAAPLRLLLAPGRRRCRPSTVEVARLLLSRGADPNAGFLWSRWYALPPSPARSDGARIGRNQPPHPECETLARLLLDAGADPNDSQVLYNRHFKDERRSPDAALRIRPGAGEERSVAETPDRGERHAGTDAGPAAVLGGDAGIPSARHAARRARLDVNTPARERADAIPGGATGRAACHRRLPARARRGEDRARPGRIICARVYRGRSRRCSPGWRRIRRSSSVSDTRAASIYCTRGGREASRRRSPHRRARRRRQRDGAWHRPRSQRAAQRRGLRQPRDGEVPPRTRCQSPPARPHLPRDANRLGAARPATGDRRRPDAVGVHLRCRRVRRRRARRGASRRDEARANGRDDAGNPFVFYLHPELGRLRR